MMSDRSYFVNLNISIHIDIIFVLRIIWPFYSSSFRMFFIRSSYCPFMIDYSYSFMQAGKNGADRELLRRLTCLNALRWGSYLNNAETILSKLIFYYIKAKYWGGALKLMSVRLKKCLMIAKLAPTIGKENREQFLPNMMSWQILFEFAAYFLHLHLLIDFFTIFILCSDIFEP